MSQEFRLKKTDERRSYFLGEIEQNELISNKHKKVCTTLNYIEYFIILASTITGMYFNFCFCFFAWCSYWNYDSAIGLKICPRTKGIKRNKSIIKKKKKKHDKIVLAAKFKSNSIEVLISKALINSNISHNEFVLINNVLKEHYNMKEEIKVLKT